MTDHVRFERKGGLGLIVLDRPGALNALDRAMVEAMSLQLLAWREDPAVVAVLVKSATERAFCAGGDVRAAVATAQQHGVEAAASYFALEYRLNWRFARLGKPCIALLDGITMGGGCGISLHGAFRVVTGRTVLAMPETAIGLFPDVGASKFLGRCPGAIGMYLALTGAKLDAGDCLFAGLGTHAVASDGLPGLETRLAAIAPGAAAETQVAAVLDELAIAPPASALEAKAALIDACFGQPDLGSTLAALEREPSGWGRAQLALLRERSPLSCAIAFRQLRAAAALTLEQALQVEYRLARRLLERGDFAEGVRALLVDRDKRPRWRHPAIEAVADAEVDAYLAVFSAGERELGFDWVGA